MRKLWNDERHVDSEWGGEGGEKRDEGKESTSASLHLCTRRLPAATKVQLAKVYVDNIYKYTPPVVS